MLIGMFHEAWSAMGANRMRSLLTMLGMVIGVGAVVLMMAIGQGAQYAVAESIDSMGSNLFIVLSGGANTGGVRSGSGNAPTLTASDAEAMRELPGVAAASPSHQGSAQLVHGALNWNTFIIGATPDYLEVRSWPLASGDPFTDSDLRSATRVALIGQTAAENLFADEDPVGKTLRIGQAPYQILGVLTRKGQSLDGRDQDDVLIVPLTTAQRKLFGTPFQGSVRSIMVKAERPEVMPQVEIALNDLLRQRHRLREAQESDFSVRNLTAIADSAAETTRVMSLLLGAIASVSLLVGGIGIMNIMLVSVTERTREIGIRMAIGARERDVLTQFLLEAIIISVVGCLIGLVLGVGGAILANILTDTPVVISGSTVIVAFSVAAATGIFFGFYPARKAARLDPIEALRYQ
ncbi:MAG: ABC transporter permease [Zoogloeaceae bacterium]|jgi:putative ABC transport system permease protein|nr:ABC transporter permease [Zoogloeaceae bacterium]